MSPPIIDDAHWAALIERLDLDSPTLCTAEELRSTHGGKGRHYHTLQHLEECLTALAHARTTSEVPNGNAIELALWFHDLVYDPRAPDNEERSAEIADEMLRRSGAAEQLRADVRRLILATKSHEHAGHDDAKWMLDIDLSIFGQSTDRFAEYERQIRQEYAWVDEVLYREKRAEILSRFLTRSRLYATDHFHHRMEARARSNLDALIRQLESSR